MKNNIWTIMKKECARFFGDKRLMFTVVILPGLLIFIMYTFMGDIMATLDNVSEDYTYQIHAVNMPNSIKPMITEYAKSYEYSVNLIENNENEIDVIKEQVSSMQTDLLVVFPKDFDTLVANYDVASGEKAPNIQIWSNLARSESATINNFLTSILNHYEYTLSNKFDINAWDDENSEEYNMASDKDMFASYMVYLLPMLLIMFICVGCQSITPESIAGEKERGTLGTLLATPAKRSDIALAKIFSVTVFGLLSGLGSFLGLILSLPNLMQSEDDMLNYYSIGDYAMLFVVSLTAVLVFVSLLSIISAYSKSIKEATSYTMPVMILSMVCGFSGMITGGAPEEFYYYFIPVFNSAQCMTAIFKFEANLTNIAITSITNVVFMVICSFALTKMFNSEKIVFDS